MLIHWLNDQKYDWSSIEVSLHVSQTLKRSKRWSILSTYTIEKYMTWEMHHDFIIKTIFLNFMRIKVLSQCTSDDSESRFVVVMNNARIHQSIELDQLCMKFEVLLIKLSSYSSDFNLIKIFFAMLKIWIKKNIELISYYTELRDEFDEFLRDVNWSSSRVLNWHFELESRSSRVAHIFNSTQVKLLIFSTWCNSTRLRIESTRLDLSRTQAWRQES